VESLIPPPDDHTRARAVSSPLLQSIRRVVEDPGIRQLPDPILLQRFTDHRDAAAFHALLLRHGAMVLDVCRSVLRNEDDAEDAFQATCLVLARRAGSIRKRASVGSWLHSVAHRTARKVRLRSATRRKNEARTRAQPAAVADDLPWREVREVLHEELAKLSERYRLPLVVCYLESRTQEEAAAELGMAGSTLKERLERGRSLLRARLVRRGLGPGAVALAAAWPIATAQAFVLKPLVRPAVEAAILVATGQTASDAVGAESRHLLREC
jgi:RNA polymerase sigma factor (sigma-70 family)